MVVPSRLRIVVLISHLHKAALKTVDYAQAVGANSVVALTAQVDEAETRLLMTTWTERYTQIPLIVTAAPDPVDAIDDYVQRLRREHPRDAVAVFIPQVVTNRWWGPFLHGTEARRMANTLQRIDGVAVTRVPWVLRTARVPHRRSAEGSMGS